MTVQEWQSDPKPCLDVDYLMQALSLTVEEARGLIMTAKGKVIRYGFRDWLGKWHRFPNMPKKSKNLVKTVI